MTLKVVSNSDSGDADHIGGNDWDNLANAVNLGEDYMYLVVRSGSTIYVKNTVGEIIHSGSDSQVEIKWALDNLTVGRTWKEKVIVKGAHDIAATILIPSYSILELRGRMKLNAAVNAPILKNTAQNASDAGKNTDIEIVGGEYDGNKANQTSGFLIHMSTAKNVKIRDIFSHDSETDGISLQGCYTAEVINCHLKDNNQCGLRATSNTTNGVAGRNLRVIGCHAEGNGINGLWVQGASASYEYYNVTMVGNTCESNTTGGLYVDFHVWGVTISGNACTLNGNTNGSGGGGGIVVNGQTNGLPYFGNGDVVVAGNSCYANEESGIMITYALNVKISANYCYKNKWRGIDSISNKQCQFTDNLCVNNSQKTTNTFEGIRLVDSTPISTNYPSIDNTLKLNRCYDDQGTKTQKYGIAIAGVAYRNYIKYNFLKGNATGSMLSTDATAIEGNEGFRTKWGEYLGVSQTGSASGLFAGSTSTLVTAFGNTGSIARAIDSTGQKMNYPTGTTINTLTGTRIGATFTERDLNPCLKAKFRINQNDANTRVFIGFSSNVGANPVTLADPLANFSGAGIWYDGGVSANLRIYTNSGGASSTNTDTTIAADTSSHELTMFFDNTNAKLYVLIDDVLMTDAAITATLPAAATDMGLLWYIENTTGSSKTFDIWNIRADQND